MSKVFREEQSDGTFKEYDVDLLSEDAQQAYELLNILMQRKADLEADYKILQVAELDLLQKIREGLSAEYLLEPDDGESKDKD